MHNSSYYTPSGKLSAMAFAWALLALPLVFAFAWVYAWATFHVPLVYVNVLILGGYALCVSVLVMMLPGTAGKVRNPLLLTLIGALIGLFAWYAQWACWLAIASDSGRLALVSGMGALDLLREPQAIRAAMAALYETGFWSIKRATVSGGWLGFFWFVEFFAIVAMGAFGGWIQAGKPFSEKRQAWAENKGLDLTFPYVSDPQAFVAEVERQPLRLSEWLDERSDDPLRWAEVTLYLCKDGIADYLSIENVEKVVEKGKEKKNTSTVLEYLKVPVWLTQPIADTTENAVGTGVVQVSSEGSSL